MGWWKCLENEVGRRVDGSRLIGVKYQEEEGVVSENEEESL